MPFVLVCKLQNTEVLGINLLLLYFVISPYQIVINKFYSVFNLLQFLHIADSASPLFYCITFILLNIINYHKIYMWLPNRHYIVVPESLDSIPLFFFLSVIQFRYQRGIMSFYHVIINYITQKSPL